MNASPRDAEPPIAEANAGVLRRFPFDDTRDQENERRGFIATVEEPAIRAADGRVVWDLNAYGFLAEDCPPTANPSLWRQSRLVTGHGLFEVTPGIYQVRGFDLSNMTLVEGERGILVIDPLVSTETAAAALALYRRHRGDRPVTGVLYTHSHVDHFGGVKGVIGVEEVAGGVPVIAPEGFLEHAVSENVYAGTAMSRRAAYMYGAALSKGPRGQISSGLGATNSTGTVTLIPPTLSITRTGQSETVDGIRMVFQMTPGTEAPAELNIHFPGHAALCTAENATHNLHNLLTLRGAQVRDPHDWAHYLTEAVQLFGDATDVVFASHHWPVWGREDALTFLSEQRDLYAYLHDQTLRLLNQGRTGPEIAEELRLPPALERAWHTHGYYGSVSHNTKAVYQRYMGWFDGNPARLWAHPPTEAATRYVDFMGGADTVLSRARASYAEGDFRWVVEVVGHVLFADPDHAGALALQANALEQLGYAARTAPGATSSSPAPSNCATAPSAPPPAPSPRTCWPPSPSTSSSTPSRSASTARAAGTPTSPSAGGSPTAASPAPCACATGCSRTSGASDRPSANPTSRSPWTNPPCAASCSARRSSRTWWPLAAHRSAATPPGSPS